MSTTTTVIDTLYITDNMPPLDFVVKNKAGVVQDLSNSGLDLTIAESKTFVKFIVPAATTNIIDGRVLIEVALATGQIQHQWLASDFLSGSIGTISIWTVLKFEANTKQLTSEEIIMKVAENPS
ncbi:MAG: hypothetical protein KJI71_01230 [Patescibacteria group bacterium]|nr:hypothetical protein [Patescibacteria group bacterium]